MIPWVLTAMFVTAGMVISICAPTAQVCSPPLRFPWDTRSTFVWSDGPERFPQVARERWRVVSQHRPRPHPWEVAWLVIGDERRFLAFVPKPNGWHLELFDADRRGGRQTFLASGESPRFPVGDWIEATMIAWEGGCFVVADGDSAEGRSASGRLFLDWRWTEDFPAPTWWGEPARAGLYLEDCRVESGA